VNGAKEKLMKYKRVFISEEVCLYESVPC